METPLLRGYTHYEIGGEAATPLAAGDREWERLRSKALSQLREHLLQGRVDPDIVDLLERINSSSDYYTTSSCSGRIQLAACEHPGEKGKLRVLAKWHRPIRVEELVLALNSSQEPSIWFSVHPPILHIVARDIEAAKRLLVRARNSGFKHSGIQGLGRRVVVEIMSMERLETPLRLHGMDLMGPWAYPMLVEAANKLLTRSKRRLEKLKELF